MEKKCDKQIQMTVKCDNDNLFKIHIHFNYYHQKNSITFYQLMANNININSNKM